MKLSIQITPEMRIRLMHAQSLEIEVPDSCVVPEGWKAVAAAILDGSVQEVVDREGRADGYRCAHCSLKAETHYEVDGGTHDAECIVHKAKAMLAAAPQPDGETI